MSSQSWCCWVFWCEVGAAYRHFTLASFIHHSQLCPHILGHAAATAPDRSGTIDRFGGVCRWRTGSGCGRRAVGAIDLFEELLENGSRWAGVNQKIIAVATGGTRHVAVVCTCDNVEVQSKDAIEQSGAYATSEMGEGKREKVREDPREEHLEYEKRITRLRDCGLCSRTELL
jgi:hypothetical protein